MKFPDINEIVNQICKKEAIRIIKKQKKTLIKQHHYFNITGSRNPVLDKLIKLIK